MELTAKNVKSLAKDCMFARSEMPVLESKDEIVRWARVNGTKGIVCNFLFKPSKIAERVADIQSMLEQLPDEFRHVGGGWSFLNMCIRKDGVRWAEHETMDLLACLAKASGLGGYTMREVASVLPGGMPYFAWRPPTPGRSHRSRRVKSRTRT